MPQGYTYHLALPEKALIDLLYLYPQYDTENEMLNLRLDDFWMQEELNVCRLRDFAERASSKSLQKRTELLLQTYRHD